MNQKILIATAITIGVVFTALAIGKVEHTEHRVKLKEIQLTSRTAELKLEKLKIERLHVEMNDGRQKTQEEINRLSDELERRKQNEQRLERELQAKLERKEQERIAAASVRTSVIQAASQPASIIPVSAPAPRPVVNISGNKHTWLAASGIPQSEWHYVDMIVSRESGWNPCAYNPGRSDCSANPSSACGLAQSLPCGKQSVYGHWTDPVANLKWQYDYVRGRYGGYAGAVAFWNANHWY